MKEQINENPAEAKRRRVDKLAESDNGYENSVYKLAGKEDEFRGKLKSKGLGKEAVGELADEYSDEVLEKIEANKDRWVDGLTGLRNRKALNEEIPQQLSNEKRQGKDCSLLMVDFDFFKKVNDEFGHAAGDQSLKAISRIIKEQVRTADIVYRYGGEEFSVFLPNTTSKEAAKLAERIREAVKQAEIELTDDQGRLRHIKKTVSIGCVGTDQLEGWAGYKEREAADILNEILNDADLGLKKAKLSGRDRVVAYDKNLKEPENK